MDCTPPIKVAHGLYWPPPSMLVSVRHLTAFFPTSTANLSGCQPSIWQPVNLRSGVHAYACASRYSRWISGCCIHVRSAGTRCANLREAHVQIYCCALVLSPQGRGRDVQTYCCALVLSPQGRGRDVQTMQTMQTILRDTQISFSCCWYSTVH